MLQNLNILFQNNHIYRVMVLKIHSDWWFFEEYWNSGGKKMENSIPSTNNIKTLMKDVTERLFCCCMMKKLVLYHMVTALCPQVTLSI